MLELFHTINSVCAQKIRIQFSEKGLTWTSRLMTLRGDQFEPHYLKLNPNGVVPTLLHDGTPIVESSVILYYLEDAFPTPSLMPGSALARAKVRLYNKLIDEKVHNACTVLTFATALRPQFLRMKHDALQQYLSSAPDQKRAAFKRDVITNGLASPFVSDALEHYITLLQWMAASLASGSYLVGNSLSLADVAVIPYITRLDLLGLSGIWGHQHSIAAWLKRMSARPAVQAAIHNAMSETDLAHFRNIEGDTWSAVSAMPAHEKWTDWKVAS